MAYILGQMYQLYILGKMYQIFLGIENYGVYLDHIYQNVFRLKMKSMVYILGQMY